jgi:hypothetical protein
MTTSYTFTAGSLYIVDLGDYRVRKVANGVITTVAGNGKLGFSGDNGLATNAQLARPFGWHWTLPVIFSSVIPIMKGCGRSRTA